MNNIEKMILNISTLKPSLNIFNSYEENIVKRYKNNRDLPEVHSSDAFPLLSNEVRNKIRKVPVKQS